MRFVVCSLLILILVTPAFALEWSMFKKDATHSGFTTDAVNPPLVLKWTLDLKFETDSSPVIANGMLYTGSNYGIHAIDAASGKEIWKVQTNGFVKSAPAVSDGTLYVGSEDKRFYAIDAKDGTIKWIYRNATDGYRSSPAAVNDLIFAGSEDGTLYAFNARTGEPAWFVHTGRRIDSSPAVSDGIVYVGNDNGVIFAFDARSGREKWHYSTGISQIKSSPAVRNGTVFIGSNDGNLYAMDAVNGTLKWKYFAGNNVESSPSVKDGTVFAGSKDSDFFAIDAQTGALKWKLMTAGYIDSSPAVSNDIVYFGLKDNFLYAIDANSGRLLWRNSTGQKVKDFITSPAISGNMLYAATHSGSIYAYSSGEVAHATPATPAETPAIDKTTVIPAPGPTTMPAETRKTPGFGYAALILLIMFLMIRKRF